MKAKYIFISVLFLSFASSAIAQDKKTPPQSIISRTAIIKKYHDKKELSEMPKGILIDLCVERVGTLIKILPYISMATKPGITLTDFGVPTSSDFKKMYTEQEDSTISYTIQLAAYQKSLLPYADKNDLIKAVLFYENIIKSLNEFDEM